MRQNQLALSAFVLLLSLPTLAQERPDFSGVWQMDASRSDSAHQAVPIGPVTLIIVQTGAEVRVETRRTEKDKRTVSREAMLYKLDGSETSVVNDSGEIKTKARWDGPKLILETARNIQDSTVTTLHVFNLDTSGKELTIDKTLTVQHGYQFPGANNTGTGKDVFMRHKGSAKS